MSKAKKTAILGVIIATAMILSFVESKIPAFVAIPGIKVGLANIAVMFTLYKIGVWEAAAVSGLRAILVSILFGSAVSLAYSLAGAAVSLTVMLLLKKFSPAGVVGVSVVGGVCHNLGQIGVACFLMETNLLLYYLPPLLLSGTVSGIAVGLAASLLIKRVKIS